MRGCGKDDEVFGVIGLFFLVDGGGLVDRSCKRAVEGDSSDEDGDNGDTLLDPSGSDDGSGDGGNATSIGSNSSSSSSKGVAVNLVVDVDEAAALDLGPIVGLAKHTAGGKTSLATRHNSTGAQGSLKHPQAYCWVLIIHISAYLLFACFLYWLCSVLLVKNKGCE